MVTYRGYKTNVIYDDETSYGSGADPAIPIYGKINTLTINRVNNLIRTLGLGDGRNETFVGYGNFECTWSMDYEIADFQFLSYLIGALEGSGTTASPYYLLEKDYMTYTAGSGNGLKSFGMEVSGEDTSGTDDVEILSGCVINSGTFTLALGETMKVSLEGFARNVVSSTDATSYSAPTTTPWTFAQGKFYWNDAPVDRVTSASITITNNFDPEVGREIGSRFVQAAEPGLRKYDWTITCKMTSGSGASLRNDFYGSGTGTPATTGTGPVRKDLKLELASGSASGSRSAQILLSGCTINDISKPINIGDNIVELTINGAATNGTTDTSNKPIKWWIVT